MSDLISRKAAIDALMVAIDDVEILDADDIKTVFDMLPSAQPETNCSEIPNNCPAADVVPVVHGVWRNGYRVQTCSVCKGTGKKSWKFCPYCGAKMDGEQE